MDEFEIRALLSAAMAYDNRKGGESAVAGWAEAANRGRWTFGEALNAIHDHYAESRDFIMPGDVTQRIRARRRRPPPVKAIAGPTKPPADPSTVRVVLRDLAEQLGWPELSRPDPAVFERDCPHCGATAGHPCIRRTRTHRRDGYQNLKGVHESRIGNQP